VKFPLVFRYTPGECKNRNDLFRFLQVHCSIFVLISFSLPLHTRIMQKPERPIPIFAPPMTMGLNYSAVSLLTRRVLTREIFFVFRYTPGECKNRNDLFRFLHVHCSIFVLISFSLPLHTRRMQKPERTIPIFAPPMTMGLNYSSVSLLTRRVLTRDILFVFRYKPGECKNRNDLFRFLHFRMGLIQNTLLYILYLVTKLFSFFYVSSSWVVPRFPHHQVCFHGSPHFLLVLN
jgi:hypothetical protein